MASVTDPGIRLGTVGSTFTDRDSGPNKEVEGQGTSSHRVQKSLMMGPFALPLRCLHPLLERLSERRCALGPTRAEQLPWTLHAARYSAFPAILWGGGSCHTQVQ